MVFALYQRVSYRSFPSRSRRTPTVEVFRRVPPTVDVFRPNAHQVVKGLTDEKDCREKLEVPSGSLLFTVFVTILVLFFVRVQVVCTNWFAFLGGWRGVTTPMCTGHDWVMDGWG